MNSALLIDCLCKGQNGNEILSILDALVDTQEPAQSDTNYSVDDVIDFWY